MFNEQKIQLSRIIETVSKEMKLQPKLLNAGGKKSRAVTDAKQFIIYFAKHYSESSNAEINEAVGLNKGKVRKSDTKAMRHHLQELTNKLQLKLDTDFCEHFDCIKLALLSTRDRHFRLEEELQINIKTIVTGKPEDNPEYRALIQKGIYPFVLKYEKRRFYGYAKDPSGSFIGQSKESYEQSLK